MNLYQLQIVTPDGLLYDGNAKKVSLRTMVGNIGIMYGHINFATAIGMGICRVDIDNEISRYAAAMGGLLAVYNGKVRIVATTFEWAETIDIERAEKAKSNAERIIESNADEEEKELSNIRLRRAEVRLGVAKYVNGEIPLIP